MWSYSLIYGCARKKKKCKKIKLKEKRKGNAKKRLLVVFFIILFFVLSLCVHKLQARHTVATIIKIIGCYGMRQLKSMTACPIYIYISPHAHLHRYQHQNKMATAVVRLCTFSAKICTVDTAQKNFGCLQKKNHIAQGHDSSQTYPFLSIYITYIFLYRIKHTKNRVVIILFLFRMYTADGVYEYHGMI